MRTRPTTPRRLATLLALGLLLVTVGPHAEAQGAVLLRQSSCVDASGVRWLARVVWGDPYLDATGALRLRVDHVGWTTDARTVPTDVRLRSFDGAGLLAESVDRTRRSDYDDGATWEAVDPVDVTTAGGSPPRVTVQLGVDGDGKGDCVMTFVEPRTPSPAAAPTASPVGDYPALGFADEFDGSALAGDRWAPCWFPASYTGDRCGRMNGSATVQSNVQVGGGVLTLTQQDAEHGALVSSRPDPYSGVRGFELREGYAEARIWFPGDGETVYNWPAWWLNGPRPGYGDGENDIAEGLGRLTVNYHDARGAHAQGAVPGVWTDAFHTYGIHRRPGRSDVYYDGRLVASYPTTDELAPQYLVLNVGAKDAWGRVVGPASAVRVDWVRVWVP